AAPLAAVLAGARHIQPPRLRQALPRKRETSRGSSGSGASGQSSMHEPAIGNLPTTRSERKDYRGRPLEGEELSHPVDGHWVWPSGARGFRCPGLGEPARAPGGRRARAQGARNRQPRAVVSAKGGRRGRWGGCSSSASTTAHGHIV